MTTTDSRSRPIQCRPSADVLAILDRIVRWIARRLADEACDDRWKGIDVLAQVQAEAAATWRSPHNGKPTVRGVERLRARCEGFSSHAGVVIADHDREALERLCRYGTRPAFAHDRLAWTADGQIAYRLKRPWPDGRTELVLPLVDVPPPAVRDRPATPSPPGALRGGVRPRQPAAGAAPRAGARAWRRITAGRGEDHRRDISDRVIAAAAGETDPDRRVLKMLGGRGSNVAVNSAPADQSRTIQVT